MSTLDSVAINLPKRSWIILQGLNMRIVISSVLFAFLFSTVSHAQFQRAQALELSCVHLYPVQLKYLEKHVNFSKLDKRLESRTIEQFVKRLDGSKLYLLDKDV